jgi:mono/diheme cytochrome c family protein
MGKPSTSLFNRLFLFTGVLLAWTAPAPRACAAEPPRNVQYNRDILPLLSENCFACHGPDKGKRKGKLRLDLRDEALKKKAIVPGKPGESELVNRLFTTVPDDLMPPEESHKTLSPAQKDLLRRWIAEGAEYQAHWAYVPPVKPGIPTVENGIDHLVGQHLVETGARFSPEADRRTLARRLYFDLTGLPPTPAEVDAFERDTAPNAPARLVDTLLASPRYGERMAIPWLDVVRFADTIGYHSDNPRNIWPYRDYVIRSFNGNKPFDRFTREQIAGDLLPGGGPEDKVGSAFNRLLLSTEEGGAQPKDYEARMLTDRVRAVGAVWLGQTVGCSQCHDHKFDPVTMRDFYSLGAFFADIQEPIIGRREDGMLVPTPGQTTELTRLDSEAGRIEKEFDGPHPELNETYARWESAQIDSIAREAKWTPLHPSKAESASGAKLGIRDDHSVLVSGKTSDKDTYTVQLTNALERVAGLRLEALPDDSLPSKGPGRAGNGNFVLTELLASVRRADGVTQPVAFASALATFEQKSAAEDNPGKAWLASATIDGNTNDFGWAVLPEIARPQQLLLELREPLNLAAGDALTVVLAQNHGHGNHTLGRFRLGVTSEAGAVRSPSALPPSKEIADVLKVPPAERTPAQKDKLFAHFKSVTPELAALRDRVAAAKKAKSDYEATVPRCLVSVSSDKPRTVRILPRGNWMIETGEIVQPALPAYLTASYKKPEGRALTRLDLAEWLVSRENPLTARVVMNRLWKQFFGIGISKVLDDFGAQGEPPSNPALLDWLACEFMDSGWDIKHMVRLMATSRTYGQISTAPKELQTRDPYNRELARQSRWRLDAELVRDNALSISGLLVEKIGGPSVKPYQPAGYWENLNFPTREWESSKGDGQYRRSLYTWWQRSYLHPSLVAFDAPSREECAADRNRSNIPQQALVLLNDPTYVEAARSFAARILRECRGDTAARVTWAWRQALQRPPREDELASVRDVLEKHFGEYRQDVKASEALLKTGMAPAPTDLDPAELAAWTSVARVILNLHETITRS